MVLVAGIPKREAEKLKQFLSQNLLFNTGYRYGKNEERIWFPVRKKFSYDNVVFAEMELEKLEENPSWREVAKEFLSEEEFLAGRFSYDTVGTIAIIEVVELLEPKEKELAQLLLDTNKHINTVLKKVAGHEGELRTQKMVYLAGEETKETISHENGVRLLVNVESVYYSVRLGTERNRIMQLVQPGENILCMFSGAAPFPVVFSRNTEAKRIVGVELNPEGHAYGLKNIALNHCTNVELFCGDVATVVPSLNERFDRITMPLPHTGKEFLPVALDAIADGGVIHYYCFIEHKQFLEEQERITELIEGRTIKNISYVICGQHSPFRHRVCYDIQF